MIDICFDRMTLNRICIGDLKGSYNGINRIIIYIDKEIEWVLDERILLEVIKEVLLWHNPQIAPTQIPPAEKLDLERGRTKKEEWSSLQVNEERMEDTRQ